MTMLALVCGVLFWSVVQNAWRDAVVKAALKNGENPQYDFGNFKPIEIPTFSTVNFNGGALLYNQSGQMPTQFGNWPPR